MSKLTVVLGGSILAASLICDANEVFSCGYEDPASASTARGILNFVYPNAMFVATAVRRAQEEGVIARDNRPAAIHALLGYQGTLRQLGMLRERLSATSGGETVSGLSVVLIGHMLWTRYALTGSALSMTPHVDGPGPDEVVIVTDEPVVTALNRRQITPQRAREIGLIRIYGPAAATRDVAAWLDRTAEAAKHSQASNGSGVAQ
jgi:hypothetical protein